jgi:iron complex outermembrane receptor protein
LHANRGRNHFYRNATAAQFRANGWAFDNDAVCTRTAPANGTPQVEGDPAASCANYYNVRINPSDTGNIRGQSSFSLAGNLRLTVDPSFQYVLANGGGQQVVPEDDMRLRGAVPAAGLDLNGDGDLLDRIALHAPNNTRTRRFGLNSALLWDFAPGRLLRLSYTLDRAWHRQTGEFGWLDRDGNPEHVFAGRGGSPVRTADGDVLRRRDRKSIALLNQVSLSYSGLHLAERLRLSLGLRAPFFERELNQYCYTPVASPGGDPWCTAQPEAGPPDADGYVRLDGGAEALYVRPYSGTKAYHRLLPSIGILLLPQAEAPQGFASYARGFSAPRNDNLYSRQIIDVRPELTDTFELGYRHQGRRVLGSATLWKTDYSNRIVSAWDEELGIATDRNVGKVKLWGIDAAVGVEPSPGFAVHGTVSYNHSQMQQDVQLDAATVAPTAGKQLVETPDVTLGARLQYRTGSAALGLQARHVGRRWSNDVNTESTGSYMLVDVDATYAFRIFRNESSVQLNVLNLLDKRYLGAISTSINGAGFYAAGAPRTLQLTWSLMLE